MTVPNPSKPSFSSIEHSRGRMTIIGVALLLLGVVAILAPVASTFVATILIGILLIAGGVVRLFHGYEIRHEHSIGWLIFSSLLYIAAGLAVLWRPLIGSFSLTLVLGTFFVVGGVSKAIRSYRLRGGGSSGWLLFDAIISVFLGILLLTGLPSTIFWALGVIVGVDLVMGGIAVIALANSSRPAYPV